MQGVYKTMKKWKLLTAGVSAVILVGLFIVMGAVRKPESTDSTQGYEVAAIGRGTVESVVSSTGTLSVVSSVSVLAEMSGRLESVKVDYNDQVKTGQVLATINTDLLRLKAKAAQASVDKARANYDLQALAVRNAKTLFDKSLLSDYDYRTSLATLDVNKAELASARASLEEIETEINQYAIVKAPIDGIVLERFVDAGQSVVGGTSGTSTSLFTIAEDLSKMQIEAEVDELDIASIKVGQDVRFTVEADSGSAFTGTVKEIRLVPEVTDNVVYYYVIILADNASGKLLPGMTASVEFINQKKSDVLVVPNAAFRFTPVSLDSTGIQKAIYLAGLGNLSAQEKTEAAARFDEQSKAPSAEPASSAKNATGLSSLMGGGMPRGMPGGGPGGPPGMGRSSGSAQKSTGAKESTAAIATVAKKTLWYLDESGKLAVVLVETGITDGSKTEIVGADELEGTNVIVKTKVK
jgi:HlyD family secretion protein